MKASLEHCPRCNAALYSEDDRNRVIRPDGKAWIRCCRYCNPLRHYTNEVDPMYLVKQRAEMAMALEMERDRG